MNNDIKPRTLEFILSQVQQGIDQQLLEERTINGQVVQLFSGGTIIAGLFGLFASLHLLNSPGTLAFAAGFIFYLLAGGLSLLNLITKLSPMRLSATLLSTESASKYIEELEPVLLKDARETYSRNSRVIGHKLVEQWLLIVVITMEFVMFVLPLAFALLAELANSDSFQEENWRYSSEVGVIILSTMIGTSVITLIFFLQTNNIWLVLLAAVMVVASIALCIMAIF